MVASGVLIGRCVYCRWSIGPMGGVLGNEKLGIPFVLE